MVGAGFSECESGGQPPSFHSRIDGWTQRLSDWLFGYDYLISYKHDDGLLYPAGLHRRLSQLGFRVFFDVNDYAAGDDLSQGTRRRVRMSSCLVVVGRRGALTCSDWVLKEVRACIESERTPIVLDIDEAFLKARGKSEDEERRLLALRDLLRDRIRLEQRTLAERDVVFDGDPSEEVIQGLQRSFKGRRQESRRKRFFFCTAVIFAALACLAVGFAYYARKEQKLAEERERATQAQRLAAEALSRALLAPRSSAEEAIAAWDSAPTKGAKEEAERAINRAFEQSNVEVVLRDPDGAPLTGAAFSSNGEFVLTTNNWCKAWVWKAANFSRPIGSIANYSLLHISSDSFSIHGDRKQVALSRYDKDRHTASAKFVNILQMEQSLQTPAEACSEAAAVNVPPDLLASDRGELMTVSFSRSGKYLVTAGGPYRAKVWDVNNFKDPKKFPYSEPSKKHHADSINSARFSPTNEDLVATASQDGHAKVWNISDLDHGVTDLRKKTTALFSAEFSPANGIAKEKPVVLTAGQDGTATLWDVDTKKQEARLVSEKMRVPFGPVSQAMRGC